MYKHIWGIYIYIYTGLLGSCPILSFLQSSSNNLTPGLSIINNVPFHKQYASQCKTYHSFVVTTFCWFDSKSIVVDAATAQHIQAVLAIAYMGVTTINVATNDDFGNGPLLTSKIGVPLDVIDVTEVSLVKNQWSHALHVGVDWRLVDSSTLQSESSFTGPIMTPPDIRWKREAFGRKNSFVIYDGASVIKKVHAVRTRANILHDKYSLHWDKLRPWEPQPLFPTPQDFGLYLMTRQGRWLAKVYDSGTFENIIPHSIIKASYNMEFRYNQPIYHCKRDSSLPSTSHPLGHQCCFNPTYYIFYNWHPTHKSGPKPFVESHDPPIFTCIYVYIYVRIVWFFQKLIYNNVCTQCSLTSYHHHHSSA